MVLFWELVEPLETLLDEVGYWSWALRFIACLLPLPLPLPLQFLIPFCGGETRGSKELLLCVPIATELFAATKLFSCHKVAVFPQTASQINPSTWKLVLSDTVSKQGEK